MLEPMELSTTMSKLGKLNEILSRSSRWRKYSFLVSGHNAINLKEREPSIGSDLMGIIPHNTWRLRYFSLLFY